MALKVLLDFCQYCVNFFFSHQNKVKQGKTCEKAYFDQQTGGACAGQNIQPSGCCPGFGNLQSKGPFNQNNSLKFREKTCDAGLRRINRSTYYQPPVFTSSTAIPCAFALSPHKSLAEINLKSPGQFAFISLTFMCRGHKSDFLT